jgi:hypothetical protein
LTLTYTHTLFIHTYMFDLTYIHTCLHYIHTNMLEHYMHTHTHA